MDLRSGRMEAAELSHPRRAASKAYTELVPTYSQHPDFSYAAFPGGLSMILSIVHAAGTSQVTTEGTPHSPSGVDELFYGRLNATRTDHHHTEIRPDNVPVRPSPFIAAKAPANACLR